MTTKCIMYVLHHIKLYMPMEYNISGFIRQGRERSNFVYQELLSLSITYIITGLIVNVPPYNFTEPALPI